MTLIASHPWGEAQIKYIPRQFSEQQIKKAADAVKPDFHVPPDTFVTVDKEGQHTLAQVPASPAKHNIFMANGTDEPALVSVLNQTNKFLKHHPIRNRHSFSDLKSLFHGHGNKPAV